jgi:hypothetical protein
MPVSARQFLRDFPLFRRQAERGETVVIESRDGARFVFHRIGDAPKPRQVESPLPRTITDKWDVDGAALSPDDWEMNR